MMDAIARRHLLPAMNNDLQGLLWLEDEISAGKALLFPLATEEKGRLGTIAVRFEENLQGKTEMVLVAAGGESKGNNLYRLFLPALEAYAKSQGAISLRSHANRRGVYRKLQSIGFKEVERIFQKVL